MNASVRTISIPPSLDSYPIANIGDLREFAKKEQEGWASLLAPISQSRRQYARLTAGALSQRNSELGRICNSIDSDDDLGNVIFQIEAGLESNGERFVSSQGQVATLIRDYIQRDVDTAGAALSYFVRTDFQRRGYNPFQDVWGGEFFRGMFAAQLLDYGVGPEAVTSARDSLESMQSGYRATLAALIRDYENQIQSNAVNLKDRSQRELEHDRDFGRSLADQQKAFSDAIAAARDEFNKLNQVFTSHMSLKAPVAYWTNKAQTARRFGILTIVAAIVAGGGLAYYFQLLATKVIQGLAYDAQAGASSPPLVWPHYSIAVATLLLGAWGIRVILRIGLGLWDVATDASERATIIQTYLAIMKEPGGVPPEAITLLLQSIVRPSNSAADNPGLFEAEALKNLSEVVKKT